ncbi:hypothetical protein SDC9_152562 [bioreactor metagenome]|uniref:Uncharacterized protein n=1 Tax=bioreactor metagenome TaxID=1076179 RepID=A0A645EVQ7_9ZZZZ
MLSCEKVVSVEMDFLSEYCTTGVSSIPLAFFQSSAPFFPMSCCSTSTGISDKVWIFRIPILESSWKVTFPTMGIFLIESGLRNGFTKSSLISSLPTGFASPVPILETVLLVDNAKEIGNPVFFVTDSAISVVHW